MALFLERFTNHYSKRYRMVKVTLMLLLVVTVMGVMSYPLETEASPDPGDGLVFQGLHVVWQVVLVPIKIVGWVLGKLF
jgi:hypothetical protein